MQWRIRKARGWDDDCEYRSHFSYAVHSGKVMSLQYSELDKRSDIEENFSLKVE